MDDLESATLAPGNETESSAHRYSGFCLRRNAQGTAPLGAAPKGLAEYVQRELDLAKEHSKTYPFGSLGASRISRLDEALLCWSQEKAKRHLAELQLLCMDPAWASYVGEPWARHGWYINGRLSLGQKLLKIFRKDPNPALPMTGDDFISVFEELSTRIGPPKAEVPDLALTSANASDVLSVVTPAGDSVLVIENRFLADIRVSDLKKRICQAQELSVELQTLVGETEILGEAQDLSVFAGRQLTLVRRKCPCESETCLCHVCHGKGGGTEPNNPWCSACGRVELKTRHHKWYYSEYMSCHQCGARASLPPCWGGATLVRRSDGTSTELCNLVVGDEVVTVKGSRRVARIHTMCFSDNCYDGKELCNFRGIWITSHHPILLGRDWYYPADIAPAVPWHEVADMVPVIINLELEGHDDTIVLEGNDMPVISCTIGKYMGKRFGYGMCTRRSTRCSSHCEQCDAVYYPSSLSFPHNRWARFPPFAQVEWDGAARSEFDYAELIFKEAFACRRRKRQQGHELVVPDVRPWKRTVLTELQDRLQASMQQLTSRTMLRLLEFHVNRRVSNENIASSDFGVDLVPAPYDEVSVYEETACGLCGYSCEQSCMNPCDACKGSWCGSCLEAYVHAQIEAAPRAAPLLPCPGCKSRVPVTTWQRLLHTHDVENYPYVAQDLLTVRCFQCGKHSSVFSDACKSDERPPLIYDLFGSMDIPTKALRSWDRFRLGDLEPRAFIDQIKPLLTSDHRWHEFPCLIADVERRLAVHLAMLQMNPEYICRCGATTCYFCKTNPCVCVTLNAMKHIPDELCPECAAPGSSVLPRCVCVVRTGNVLD